MNPFLKYNNGGPIDPKNKVTIDGKEYDINSPEYRKLYKEGISSVDSEGMPNYYSQETAVVTGKAPDWLKVKRGEMTKGMAMSRAAWKELGNEALEMSGLAGTGRFMQNPYENIKGAYNTAMAYTSPYMGIFSDYNPDEDPQKFWNTVDAAGLATAGASVIKKPAKEALEQTGKYLITNTPVKNTYMLNPYANKLNNKNAYYRVAGIDSYDDMLESGVVRSGEGTEFNSNGFIGKRKTPFPSFAKGSPIKSYASKKIDNVIYESEFPMYKRGDINPVTGNKIKGSHGAYRPIDEAGNVINELPASNVDVFEGTPHWLKGYKKLDNPYSVQPYLENVSQSGFTWGLNPMSYLLGSKMPKDVYYRKIGSSKGMKSMIENKALVSPNSTKYNLSELGGNYTFYSRGNKPDESYKGIYAVSYNPEKTLGQNVDGFRHFMGPRGKHRGLTPIDKQGNSMYIPIDDEGVDVWRRLPFSNSYTKVNKDKILNGNYSGLNEGLDYLQNISEKGVKGVLYGSLAQMGLNSMFGDTPEEEDPNNPGYHISRKESYIKDTPDKFKPTPFGKPLYKQIYDTYDFWKNEIKKARTNQSYRNGGPVDPEDKDAAMRGMMKARMAIDSHFGNKSAQRMTSVSPKEYIFTGEEFDEIWNEPVGVPKGASGTHFMSSTGEYAVPHIQENWFGTGLSFNKNPYKTMREAMKFETPEEAQYFSEHYKDIAPMMYKFKDEMKSGGDSNNATIEIERSERVYTPDGKLVLETPSDAPTHEQGGVVLENVPAGYLVFPKKWFNKLDRATNLPNFMKVKNEMLKDAAAAYKRGEKYSSGGNPN